MVNSFFNFSGVRAKRTGNAEKKSEIFGAEVTYSLLC